ncbi:MAG: hypothetical protein BM556_18070 [Bacteriovorax sp. MedPE-SWde]|nr:MAG: hypothetical protein BM556_18070 [Bacteriovorax sp. MedPE-SWde]
MNKVKVGYYTLTGLLTLMLTMSAGMYIFNYDEIAPVFSKLGYPVNIIYPLALAKILALIAIWTRKSKALLTMAYVGLFYNFILAFYAHVAISDGEFAGAVIATLLLAGSYFSQNKYFAKV